MDHLLNHMPLPYAAAAFLIQNVLIFATAVLAGGWLVKRFEHLRVTAPPPAVSGNEKLMATSTVVLNSAITLLGLVLYRHDILVIRTAISTRALFDVIILLLTMDLTMYLLHRVAHHPWLYPLLHAQHHRYRDSRPLTLFVLNPLETLSFGGLWLATLWLGSLLWNGFSWLGIAAYLTLNLIFGVMGHLGVEPLPAMARRRGWNLIDGSTFHGGHHQEEAYNYGFYTTLWDRLFGTMDPRPPVEPHLWAPAPERPA